MCVCARTRERESSAQAQPPPQGHTSQAGPSLPVKPQDGHLDDPQLSGPLGVGLLTRRGAEEASHDFLAGPGARGHIRSGGGQAGRICVHVQLAVIK